MKINSLLKNVEVLNVIQADVEINNVQFDSRKVESGDVFVAVNGTETDGHKYIPSAIEKGAAAIVYQEEIDDALLTNPAVQFIKVANSMEALGMISSNFYGRPSEKLTLVGVTGTNGKTTTATLLYELFKKMGYKAGLLSTVCNYVDDRAVAATHTTPDPLELNSLLAEMVAAGCEFAFMEASSHAIDQRRIAGLKFKGAIFTNITRDHLDYHKTFENYLKAKKRFFDDLTEDAFALTNLDDKNGMVMLQNTKAVKKTYSLRSMADFKTKILEDSFDGLLLNMNGHEVSLPFIGRFNASNLTAVFGAAVLLGYDENEILRHLSELKPVSGRFETIYSSKGFVAIVDYAHTPDALTNVLSTINDIRNGKGNLITVVGCGGNRDKGKRPLMAQESSRLSDRVIFTSDNPRFEEPMAIINDMLAGLTDEEKKSALVIADRREAIKTACALAQKGDVILVAGKGHEDYQIVNGVKHHFDDKEEIHAAIGE